MRRFGRKFRLMVLCAGLIALPTMWERVQPRVIDCRSLNAIGNVTSFQSVPDDLRKLDGKHLIVRGNIFWNGSSRDLRLYDGPKWSSYFPSHLVRPEDFVFVTLPPSVSLPSDQQFMETVDVSGIFHIRIDRDDDGRIASVFHLDADLIAPAPANPPAAHMWVSLARLAGIVGLISILIVPLGLVVRENIIAYRRLKSGNCPRCEYDLRATPNRCPECGWSPLEPLANCPDH